MLISTIVLLVVRLFSLQWLIQGLSMLAFAFPEVEDNHGSSFIVLRFLPSLLVILLAVVAWFIAPLLSRLIPGRQDASIPVSGLSLRDMYSFAFVFLGLYFALSSLADVLNWLHYAFLVAAAHDFDPERKKSLYGLSRPIITFVAGLICLFSGRRWASKLSESELTVKS